MSNDKYLSNVMPKLFILFEENISELPSFINILSIFKWLLLLPNIRNSDLESFISRSWKRMKKQKKFIHVSEVFNRLEMLF